MLLKNAKKFIEINTGVYFDIEFIQQLYERIKVERNCSKCYWPTSVKLDGTVASIDCACHRWRDKEHEFHQLDWLRHCPLCPNYFFSNMDEFRYHLKNAHPALVPGTIGVPLLFWRVRGNDKAFGEIVRHDPNTIPKTIDARKFDMNFMNSLDLARDAENLLDWTPEKLHERAMKEGADLRLLEGSKFYDALS